jgi:hypothetical protein
MSQIESPEWEKVKIIILAFDINIYLNLTSKYLHPVIRSVCIPKSEALDIYASRAKSPRKVMIGFDLLIHNLENFEDDLVCIHSVSEYESIIVFFSDCNYIKVLGFLCLPNFLDPL